MTSRSRLLIILLVLLGVWLAQKFLAPSPALDRDRAITMHHIYIIEMTAKVYFAESGVPAGYVNLIPVLLDEAAAEEWMGSSLEKSHVRDGWGNDIKCYIENRIFHIRSAGSDGVLHTEDDISKRYRIPTVSRQASEDNADDVEH